MARAAPLWCGAASTASSRGEVSIGSAYWRRVGSATVTRPARFQGTRVLGSACERFAGAGARAGGIGVGKVLGCVGDFTLEEGQRVLQVGQAFVELADIAFDGGHSLVLRLNGA